jgi:GTP-binding protein EngB required for normal cell division
MPKPEIVDTQTSPATPAMGGHHLPLREYERLKLDLATLIHSAVTCAADDQNDSLRRAYQDIATSLAEDRFHLAVVGQSSRGKSTLMNAVLGMDRLPTGIVPITSVITSVSYGSRERVRLFFQNSILYHEAPLSELPNYITEQGNPGNQRKIEVAEVQLPAEVLQRGFLFVDTPGFGSVIAENTETTKRFFPKADAFLFVTSFDIPFSAEELGFLREACARHRKVFFIVNKADLVSRDQYDAFLSFIRGRLAEQLDSDQIEIFALSAREALAAKLNHSAEQLEKSGLRALESALVDFLTAEKSRALLAQACHRFESLLAGQSNPRLVVVKERLSELRPQIVGEGAAVAAKSGPDWGTSSGTLAAPRSCLVCANVVREIFNFLSRYQYELSRNLDEQDVHAGRSGFCPLHTWQYARIASPQGICTAYPKLLFSLADRLRDAWQQSHSLATLRELVQQMLPSSNLCVLCEVTATVEKRVIEQIITSLSETIPSDHSHVSLCLPHLALTLDAVSGQEVGLPLIRQIDAALDRAAENMQRYALKHEGLRRELVSDEEWQAPEFGLALVVGDRRVQPSRILRSD